MLSTTCVPRFYPLLTTRTMKIYQMVLRKWINLDMICSGTLLMTTRIHLLRVHPPERGLQFWNILADAHIHKNRGFAFNFYQIILHNKTPVSFHTAHPSIAIQKFCQLSNSKQESFLFPYKVEKGCFLTNNYFNMRKACVAQSKKQFKCR